MATPKQIEKLEEIFGHLDYPEKVVIEFDHDSRDVVIYYPDMDREWFQELLDAAASSVKPEEK